MSPITPNPKLRNPAELLGITLQGRDYRPEVVAAAERELKEWAIPEAELEALKAQWMVQEKARIQIANEPLPTPWRIMVVGITVLLLASAKYPLGIYAWMLGPLLDLHLWSVCFWLFLPFCLMQLYLHAQGAEQKRTDAGIYFFGTVVVWNLLAFFS